MPEQHGPDEGCFHCASDDEILSGLFGNGPFRTLHMQGPRSICPFEVDPAADLQDGGGES